MEEKRHANDELLARLDERSRTSVNEMTEVKYTIQQTHKMIEGIYDILERNYVTQAEFKPVKALVYGGVGTVLTIFLLSVLALVVAKVF